MKAGKQSVYGGLSITMVDRSVSANDAPLPRFYLTWGFARLKI